MSSDTQRSGKFNRPSWNYTKGPNGGWPGHDSASVEMLESIRNAVETLGQSQIMQCDVAHAIKSMSKVIARIDRRLAKLEGMKLGGK
jgi:hypothetical protein